MPPTYSLFWVQFIWDFFDYITIQNVGSAMKNMKFNQMKLQKRFDWKKMDCFSALIFSKSKMLTPTSYFGTSSWWTTLFLFLCESRLFSKSCPVDDWLLYDTMAPENRVETVCITAHEENWERLDKQLLKCNNQICIEMNSQVKTTVGKRQLMLFPKQAAVGAYSECTRYLTHCTIKSRRLAYESTRYSNVK